MSGMPLRRALSIGLLASVVLGYQNCTPMRTIDDATGSASSSSASPVDESGTIPLAMLQSTCQAALGQPSLQSVSLPEFKISSALGFQNSGDVGTGNLYLVDNGNARLRKLSVAGNVVSTYAGTGVPGGGSSGPATSVRLAYQYKMVNTTATQNWDPTWTGSADWGTVGAIFDVFPSTDDPTVAGNPSFPCIAGFEGLPVGQALVPVDTGTQYLFEHETYPNANNSGDYSCGVEFETPETNSQHSLIFELYSGTADQMYVENEVTVVKCQVDGGSTTGTVSGGFTFVDALSAPGGGQVVMDDGEEASILFNVPAADVNGRRIVRVGLRYIAWKDDSSPSTPSEGVEVQWCDSQYTPFGSATCVDMGAWLTLEYEYNSRYVTRWLGEVNYIPINGYDPLDDDRPSLPFTAYDLVTRMGVSNLAYIKFIARRGDDVDAPATDTIRLDYVELIIETAVEKRLGYAVRQVSTYNFGNSNINSFGREDGIILKDPNSTANDSAIIPSGEPLVLGIRESIPATPSDYFRNLTSSIQVAEAEAIGPSPLIKGVLVPRDTLEPRPDVYRASISGGILNGNPTELDQYILSVCGFPQSTYMLYGPFWTGYSRFEEKRFNADSGADRQDIKVDNVTEFDRIKLVVKPEPGLIQNLDISVRDLVLSPLATASVTPAQARAGLPLGNGYFEVSVPLSTPITSPVFDQMTVLLDSTAPYPTSWWVARAWPYGDAPAMGYHVLDVARAYDFAVVLQCSEDGPTVTIVDRSVTLERPSCGNSAGLEYPQIRITPVGQFDRYVIYRSINITHLDATPVAVLDDTNFVIDIPSSSYAWNDYGVPWDISGVYYRVLGYRDADREVFASSWVLWSGGPAVSPGPAFGLSDQSTGTIAAFDPIDPSDMNIVWSSLNPIEQVMLHGLDYSIALRAPEERGLSTTVPVLIDNMFTCDSTPITAYDEDIVPGAKAMTPSPFDTLRLLENSNRLVLQLPGGHTRWVSLDLGGMTIRTAGAVYMAEITLTDVIRPPSDPYLGRH